MRVAWLWGVGRGVVVMLGVGGLAGCAHRVPRQYAGTWVLRASDESLMLLTTRVHHGHLRGELTLPKSLTEQADGSFVDMRAPMETRPVAGRRRGRAVEMEVGRRPDVDPMRAEMPDGGTLLLERFAGVVPAWRFLRVRAGDRVVLKTDWPGAVTRPEVLALQGRLRAAAAADRMARERTQFDDEEISRLAEQALPLLEEIFAAYGWPTVTTFGAQAAEDFWLLVQHQALATEERMLGSMRAAMEAGEASKVDFAYLSDRVAVGEGRPQHWGTQSRCENGHAVLAAIDADVREVDGRREAIGLGRLTGQESEAVCQHAP